MQQSIVIHNASGRAKYIGGAMHPRKIQGTGAPPRTLSRLLTVATWKASRTYTFCTQERAKNILRSGLCQGWTA